MNYLIDDNYNNLPNQSTENINFLKKNLTEASIYSQLFNKYKPKMEMPKEEISEEKELFPDEKYFLNHEQIDETKYNLIMILWNDCKYNGEYSDVINSQNKFRIKRLVIEDFSISDNKL